MVVSTFVGNSGRRVQFELYDTDCQTIPFSAAVEDASGKQLGISDPTG